MNTIRIPRILAAVYGQPWAVLPGTLQAIRETVDRYAMTRADAPIVTDEAGPEPTTAKSGRVGIVRMQGIIGQHLSGLETMCGGYDLAQLSEDLGSMANDASVDRVLLLVRSPGGSGGGVPEAAALVRDFPKDLVALTDDMAASAAYWIASQAKQFWITPSSEAGSIGVYSAIVDESAAWAKEGYKMELMKAGKHKAAGIPGLPLADEDKAIIQAEVDGLYEEFKAAVRAGRGDISDEVMQGQMFRGQKAVDVGLADLLVPSLEVAVEVFSE